MLPRRLLWITALISSTLVVIFFYTLLHEGGHALVGMLFGGKVLDFNLNFIAMTAHVGLDGEFTTPQHALISLAGIGLPILLWFVLITVIPRTQNVVVELVKLAGSMVVLNTLLAWVVIPVLVLTGTRPGDDSANFLGYTGLHPLIVTAAALLIYGAGFWWYFRRAGGVAAVRRVLVDGAENIDSNASRRALGVMVGLLAVVIAAGLFTGAFANGGSFYGGSARVPEGFELLQEVDLSQQAYHAETLGWFTVEKSGLVKFFVNPQKVNTPFIDLALAGQNGSPTQLFHAEDYRADNDRITFGLDLEAGEYRIVLYSEQSKGVVSVYWMPPEQ